MKNLLRLCQFTALSVLLVSYLSASANVDFCDVRLLNRGVAVEQADIAKDLKSLLVRKSDVTTQLYRDNLILLQAAIKYRESAAWVDVLGTFVGAFALRQPITGTLVWLRKAGRFWTLMRSGQSMRAIDLSAITATEGTAVLATAITSAGAVSYLSTTFYLEGACKFSCPEALSERITVNQEAQFLRSQTYQNLEREIGADRARRLFDLIKTLRTQNYASDDAIKQMHQLVRVVTGKDIKELNASDISNFKTFMSIVHTLNGAYELDSLVSGYLYETGRLS